MRFPYDIINTWEKAPTLCIPGKKLPFSSDSLSAILFTHETLFWCPVSFGCQREETRWRPEWTNWALPLWLSNSRHQPLIRITVCIGLYLEGYFCLSTLFVLGCILKNRTFSLSISLLLLLLLLLFSFRCSEFVRAVWHRCRASGTQTAHSDS